MIKETAVKYQLALFGDFSNITPNEQTLKKCIEKFFIHGYIPNGNIQELDPRTNKPEPRLSLQSIRNGIAANVLNGRIDIIANPVPGSPSATLTIPEFKEQCVILTRSLSQDLNVDFHRLGFVVEFLFGELAPAKLNLVNNHFSNPNFNAFPELETTEWTHKQVSREIINLANLSEIYLNHSLSQVHVQYADQNGQREFESLHLAIDINTPPDQRIVSSIECAEQFLELAIARQETITDMIGKVIRG